MPDAQQNAKLNAARVGAAYVQSGMIVGLGSGSTAELLVAELGRRIAAESLTITAVSTSERTSFLAQQVGIRVVEPDSVERLELILDGADEVDPQFRMIKGRGGALLREKIVACAAARHIILVDPTKPVEKLGVKHSLPVEISDFGRRWTLDQLSALGSAVTLRTNADGSLYTTDGGNRIADLRTGPIENPELLQSRLLQLPGVYETGLFLGLCDILVIGTPDSVVVKEKPAEK